MRDGNRNVMVNRRASLGLLAGGAVMAAAPSLAQGSPPLRISGMIQAVELGPVYVALEKYYLGTAGVQYGGIPNLFPEHWGGPIKGMDVAGHAETQALRNSVAHPNTRIIFTVAQGHYRILARRSAGIAKLGDLKGKRIATMYMTSAGFYLSNMLELAGLTPADVEIMSSWVLTGIAEPLLAGKADALAIWEPEMEMAIRALAKDAIVFDQDPRMYENYNLNTTAENLADPVMRKKIVEFIAAMILATEDVKKDPSLAITRAAEMSKYPREPIAAAYGRHSFPGKIADGLLETMVKEEQWLAPQSGRTARGRDELARLIDHSVVEEARTLLRQQGKLPA